MKGNAKLREFKSKASNGNKFKIRTTKLLRKK